MLEMAGRAAEAAAAWKQAIEQHPTRPDLYRELAALFLKDQRKDEALEVLDKATSALPDDAGLAMMKDSLKTSTSN
jgi:Flp pilus assembly protein TadD